MKSKIIEILNKVAIEFNIQNPKINIEYPDNKDHGDFSTNFAMLYAKQLNISPKQLAEQIIEKINKNPNEIIESVNIAGPGFINFKIKDTVFKNEIIKISENLNDFGKNNLDKNKEVMIEYTDPNPFKIFHIGHLMANTIGESISRIVSYSNAKVIRACYQGDVGLHVAKTVWAMTKNIGNIPAENIDLEKRIKFLGEMYVYGENQYADNENSKKEIIEINKKIFNKSDEEINKIYNEGRKISLEYFDTIYKKLGTKFDNFFFESEVASLGVKKVNENLEKGVFEKSDGAIIFPGEKYGEHTRVFINSEGLPTYEAKEIGLTFTKFDLYPKLNESIVITANEQNAYFKVIISAFNQIDKNIASKMKHLSHGILRPSTGKMSSRKGNIIPATELIEEFEKLVDVKMKGKDFEEVEYKKIKNQIAIAGLKYTILRQSIGGDIIYDADKAISFEGDSGPYLQYGAVRANAILAKAKDTKYSNEIKFDENISSLEKKLIRFNEVVERSRLEYAPNYLVTYLIDLVGEFNSYYTNNQILDEKSEYTAYRIMITKMFAHIMKSGLWILGIEVPSKM